MPNWPVALPPAGVDAATRLGPIAGADQDLAERID
jgi:hypothetical protein